MSYTSFSVYEAADKSRATRSKGRAFWRSDIRTLLMYLADFALILIGAHVAWLLRFDTAWMSEDYFWVVLLACAGWWIMVNRSDLYSLSDPLHLWGKTRKISINWCYVVLGCTAIAFATKSGHGFSRLWAGMWFVFAGAGLVMMRIFWNMMMIRAERLGHLFARIAIVSIDLDRTHEMLDMLKRRGANTVVVGIFSSNENSSSFLNHTRVGDITQLIDQCHTLDIDSVWLAADWEKLEELEQMRCALSVLPCEIHAPIMPIAKIFPGREVGFQAGLPAVTLGRKPLSSGELVLKRLEDLIIGGTLLLLLSPLLLLIGLAIRLDSPGPALFRQDRHGFANGTFKVFKFRTMYQPASGGAQFKQAVRNDPRVTRLGRFLRRSSIDELPQLLNVVRGEMSLVGPRPHPIALSHQFLGDVETYLARHKMKPGITGWAQIHGLRGETETLEKMSKRVEYDLWYVDHWSILLDFRILVMTLPSLLSKNAY